MMTKKLFRVFLFLCLFYFVSVVSAQNVPVKELLQPYVDSGELPGVVTVIADKDKILQIDAIGYADIEAKRPMSADTIFWVASQTKPVTAIAVMMLVEEGKLSLDEPVTKYIPELKELRVANAVSNIVNRAGWASFDNPSFRELKGAELILTVPNQPITLRKLLSHTAGMAFLTRFQLKHGIDSLPTERALTTFLMTPLQYQPGTKFAYSNIGIDIAAIIVERVSQMPFETFLEKRLFEPLEMKETSFWLIAEQTKRLAKPYKWDKETNKLIETKISLLTYPPDNRTIRFANGGGGLCSTPKEWIRIYQMLAGDGMFKGKKILSPESVKEIRTKQTGDLPENYGLGVFIDGNTFGHSGSHGTESKLNTKTGRITQYFIQQENLPKANEAQNNFNKAAQP
ncbi:MAG: beta-lactamase family protein [Planctomycetaceae bacterium]|jgi:CubicO group peptidase (beta-lactamase class C family)|nr:beta-lactamase family protein [Planctomycetaceae bacterium]